MAVAALDDELREELRNANRNDAVAEESADARNESETNQRSEKTDAEPPILDAAAMFEDWLLEQVCIVYSHSISFWRNQLQLTSFLESLLK